MEPTKSFEKIARAWIIEYDRRFPREQEDRIEAFEVLFIHLALYGYAEEEHLTTSRKKNLILSCLNPNHDPKRLKVWYGRVEEALEDAIVIHYDADIVINKDVVTQEFRNKMKAFRDKKEESRKLSAESANPDETVDLKDEPEFEITDEMLDKMDGPDIEWDVDFNKKLGIE